MSRKPKKAPAPPVLRKTDELSLINPTTDRLLGLDELRRGRIRWAAKRLNLSEIECLQRCVAEGAALLFNAAQKQTRLLQDVQDELTAHYLQPEYYGSTFEMPGLDTPAPKR